MFTDRAEYQKLINLAKSGGTDVIVVMKLDRLNRDYANGETAIRLLNSFGCYVIAGDMKNSETPVDEFTRGILMLQNQYIVRLIASDTMRVEINNVKNGLSAGGQAPYGYTTVEKRYCINETEAPAIRLMFKKIAEGESYKQVIDELSNLGYTTRNGRPFSYSSLNAILKNHKYCGVYIYNKKGGKRKKNRVLIEEFDEIRNDTAIPPIITKKQFDKVQDILNNRNTVSTPKADSSFILTGLVYCKQCGTSMSGLSQISGRNKTKYRTYACPKHLNKNGKSCDTKPINADYLEKTVKEIITESVNDYIQQSPLSETILSETLESIDKEIAAMKRNKNDIDVKINNLVDRITRSGNQTLISKYETNIVESEKKQQTLKSNIDIAENKKRAIETLRKNGVVELLSSDELFTDINESRKLIRIFIKCIEISDSDDEINIIFNT